MNSCGSCSHLNYNIHDNKNDGSNGPWRQYGGTGFKINENLRARMADHCGDSFHIGRWSWVKIKGKDKKCTVFISAYRYRPCKNTVGINPVWNQQVRFFQYEDWCQDPDILENFDTQLCYFIGKIRDEGHNVALGMDANDDVRNGKISQALEDIDMSEAIIKFHKDRSPPATCATNTQHKVIDSIWTSPGIHILWVPSFP